MHQNRTEPSRVNRQNRVNSPGKTPGSQNRPAVSRSKPKSPGIAAVLSAFLWGGGQVYNGNLLFGLLGIWALGFVAVSTLLMFKHGEAGLAKVVEVVGNEMDVVRVLMIVAAVFGLFWGVQVSQAYRRAARRRASEYTGTDSLAMVCLCGWMPGVGYYLNGQKWNALLFLPFSALAVAGGVYISWFSVLWPYLDALDARILAEQGLVVSALLIAMTVAIGVPVFYDVIGSQRHPERKAPIGKRMRWAFERAKQQWRRQGAGSFVMPFVRKSVWGLIAAATITAAVFLIPRKFYIDSLRGVANAASAERMVLVPEPFQALAQLLEDSNHPELLIKPIGE